MKNNVYIVYSEYIGPSGHPNGKISQVDDGKELAYYLLQAAKDKDTNIQVFTVNNGQPQVYLKE